MKFDIRAKLRFGGEVGKVTIRRTQPTAWQEMALYLECVAFLAGNAIEEANPEHPKNRQEMVDYITEYLNRAIPGYTRVQ